LKESGGGLRRDRSTGRGEPIVLFSAFQKSTVFEKVTKHRETVAEGNVFETRVESAGGNDRAWTSRTRIGMLQSAQPTWQEARIDSSPRLQSS
jgi:hypothetical protein